MGVREKEVEGLKSQALALSQEDSNTVEVDGKLRAVEDRFVELRAPLRERCEKLLASKEEHQFNRDLEDEIVSLGRGDGLVGEAAVLDPLSGAVGGA